MTREQHERRWGQRLALGACLTLSLGMFAPAAGGQTRPDTAAAPDSADRSAIFLFQPGMLSADFASAAPGNPSTSGFYLRFATRLPTRWRWITPIAGGSVTPYGTTGASLYNHNGPTLFAGNVFPVLHERHTGGWLTLELPLLLSYSFGGGGPRNQQIYGKDVVVEAALGVHVGRQVLRDLGGVLSRLQLYVLLDQSLTPNEDPATGNVDRFSPVALYGVTLPLGGRRDDRR